MKRKYIFLLIFIVLILSLLYNLNKKEKNDTTISDKSNQSVETTIEPLKRFDTTLVVEKYLLDEKKNPLVVEKIFLDEKEDTLQKEDLLLNIIYRYKDGKIIREDIGNSSIIYYYDNHQNLIKQSALENNKEIVLYEAKFENNNIIESTNYGYQNPFIISYYYDKSGKLIKKINHYYDWTILIEYLDNKLVKESIYYNKDNTLLGMRKYDFKNDLLVRKTNLNYNLYENKFSEDSTFQFEYDKNGNLIEEKVTVPDIVRYLDKKQNISVVKLIKYKYDRRNNLIEKIIFDKDTYGAIDKSKYKKITYVYDAENRIIEEKEKSKFLGEVTYKYNYKILRWR